MDLNEELRKRHGITRITSLHHAELTPAMLPQSIGHYRGWIYDKNSFTLDQVRAFVYNACISCVSAAQMYGLPILMEDRPHKTHLSVHTTEECTRRNYDALTTCSFTGNPS